MTCRRRRGCTGVRWPAASRGVTAAEAGESEPDKDLSNPNNWPLGKVVAEKGFTTDTNGVAKLSFKLAAGAYRAVLETQDRFGKKVTGKLPLQVLQPEAAKLAIRIPQLLAAPDGSCSRARSSWRCGARAMRLGGRSSRSSSGSKMVQRYWTKAGPDPAADQAGGDRGDARRLLRARDLRPREPRLPGVAQGQRAVEEQGPGAEVGAFRLEAAAGTEGDVDAESRVQQSPKQVRRSEVRRRRWRKWWRRFTTSRWMPLRR